MGAGRSLDAADSSEDINTVGCSYCFHCCRLMLLLLLLSPPPVWDVAKNMKYGHIYSHYTVARAQVCNRESITGKRDRQEQNKRGRRRGKATGEGKNSYGKILHKLSTGALLGAQRTEKVNFRDSAKRPKVA